MSLTAAQIDRYLKGKGSPLLGYGKSFVSAGRRYGVSPALLVAIAGAESSFGKINSGTNNPFGWGPGINFGSWDAGINAVAKGLKSGYLDQGKRSIAAIGAKYAPGNAANDPTGLNSHWTKNVTQFYKELGAGRPLTAPVSGSEPQIDPNMGSTPAVPDLSSAALTSLGRTSQGRTSPTEDLADLVASVSAGRVGGGRPVTTGASPPPSSATNLPTPGTAGPNEWVKVPPRRGKWPGPGREILSFAARIAQAYGKPLSAWDTSTHSHLTTNGRVSAHTTGNALDLPATGASLRRLGYIALRRAGMGERAARKAQRSGGLFNIGGYQIIFATQIGGDHDDHLHIGIRH